MADYVEGLRRDIQWMQARRAGGGDPIFQVTWSSLYSELTTTLRVGTLELSLCVCGNPLLYFNLGFWGWWSSPHIDGESGVTLGPLCVIAEIEPLTWTRRLLADVGRD